jgi:hypothetical protein
MAAMTEVQGSRCNTEAGRFAHVEVGFRQWLLKQVGHVLLAASGVLPWLAKKFHRNSIYIIKLS